MPEIYKSPTAHFQIFSISTRLGLMPDSIQRENVPL